MTKPEAQPPTSLLRAMADLILTKLSTFTFTISPPPLLYTRHQHQVHPSHQPLSSASGGERLSIRDRKRPPGGIWCPHPCSSCTSHRGCSTHQRSWTPPYTFPKCDDPPNTSSFPFASQFSRLGTRFVTLAGQVPGSTLLDNDNEPVWEAIGHGGIGAWEVSRTSHTVGVHLALRMTHSPLKTYFLAAVSPPANNPSQIANKCWRPGVFEQLRQKHDEGAKLRAREASARYRAEHQEELALMQRQVRKCAFIQKHGIHAHIQCRFDVLLPSAVAQVPDDNVDEEEDPFVDVDARAAFSYSICDYDDPCLKKW
ncbi:hypothetical protein C8R44DRAFT_883219 [Mycena epipterygia]|nr:hypothetical protein C8R44DRAFT_883219 [Mycena epipterygia]